MILPSKHLDYFLRDHHIEDNIRTTSYLLPNSTVVHGEPLKQSSEKLRRERLGGGAGVALGDGGVGRGSATLVEYPRGENSRRAL